jgi:hypothetical protein
LPGKLKWWTRQFRKIVFSDASSFRCSHHFHL